MRPRVVMLLAFVIAAVAVGFTGARFTLLPSAPPAVHGSLPTNLASYLGVFEDGSPPGYQPIEEFAQTAGRQPNLVGYYSGWAEPFQTLLRGHDPQAWRHPVCADRPHARLGRGHRRRGL